MAYEYLWNCTANLQGNTCHNIPNDNLAHGSNATYKSARNAALSLQIQEEILIKMKIEMDKKDWTQKTPTIKTE